MKKSYLLILCLLAFLSSCKNDDSLAPVDDFAGFNWDEVHIEVDYSVPSFTKLRIKIPESNSIKVNSIYLSETPVTNDNNSAINPNLEGGDYIKAFAVQGLYKVEVEDGFDPAGLSFSLFVVDFTKLPPATTYYPIVELTGLPTTVPQQVHYYAPDFSFTTPKDGDYSTFGTPTIEKVETSCIDVWDKYTVEVWIKMPANLRATKPSLILYPELDSEGQKFEGIPILKMVNNIPGCDCYVIYIDKNADFSTGSKYGLYLYGDFEYRSMPFNIDKLDVDGTIDLAELLKDAN